jgi:pimeloyl-ACP methyl ester carboxylesterase
MIELLHHRVVGDGPPLLLIHGAAEDVGMLTPQAEAFAARGRRTIVYDRRGTGGSTRNGWPDGGVARHADDAAELHTGIMAPIEAHLAVHPDDWTGAYAVLLEVLSEGRADLDAPAVRLQMVNAEAALRDDARVITTHAFAPGELPADRVTIAVGGGTSPLHAAVAEALGAELRTPTLVVADADEHEIYLTRPDVLAEALANRQPAPG